MIMLLKKWVPNYGAWRNEWDAIIELYNSYNVTGLNNAVDTEWKYTDCYFGGSFDIPTTQRLRLDKPYLRVDKDALCDLLTNHEMYDIIKYRHNSKSIGLNMHTPSDSIVHDEFGSTIILAGDKDDDTCTVRCKLIVDCTGHETSLILRDIREPYRNPGYQIAYGVLVEVEDSTHNNQSFGPYAKNAMTLFDYRTDHIPTSTDDNDNQLKSAIDSPTFMYAMPLSDTKIFFEETSLVGRPAVSFEVCKKRCFQRLEHLGIKVKNIEEEEYCYIPMGGPLPQRNQRIVGFGGGAVMVHPSTGYTLCRTLIAAGDVAKSIITNIKQDSSTSSLPNPDKIAAQAYHAIWSPSNIRQRNFAVFGGEFLLKQNVIGVRGFFDGFFRLDTPTWHGFLAGWPGLPNNEKHESWEARIYFGLLFVSKLPFKVAADLLSYILLYSLQEGTALMQSVTPIFGNPQSYEYKDLPKLFNIGDVAAKQEAMNMIRESLVTKDIPVAFGATTKSLDSVDGEQEEEITMSNAEQDVPDTPKEVIV